MKKATKPIPPLFQKIAEIIEEARRAVAHAANLAMVHTYFEIGRMIVEDEQQGHARAAYGKQILRELSERLTERFGKGFSTDNLDRMRNFYRTYNPLISATVLRKFTLSWSHYLVLMRIQNPDERSFYEMPIFMPPNINFTCPTNNCFNKN